MLLIELQRENEGINKRNYHLYLGVTTACSKITMGATQGIGQRDIKGDSNDCFIFDIWLSSKKLAESAMDVGADMIVMVKNNKKILLGDY